MARQVILTLLLVAIVGVAMASEAPTSSPKSSPAASSPSSSSSSSSSPAASPKSSPKSSSPSPSTSTNTSSPVASPPTMEDEISSPPTPAPQSPFLGFGTPADGPAVVVADVPAPAPAPPADETTNKSGASALGVSAFVVVIAGFLAF